METKDERKGQKVVPHSKTAGEPWEFVFDDSSDPVKKFFEKHGYLRIKFIDSIDGSAKLGFRGNSGYWFNASDFEPYVEPEADKAESRGGAGG